MTGDFLINVALFGFACAIAVFVGIMIRPSGRERGRRDFGDDRRRPPDPPEYFRARINPPMLSTYDGAARLQRARRAASDFIAEIGSTNEILPGDQSGIPRTGPRPFGPIDVDAMTRAIVTAWIGEDEPMVSVPIMKLGDIKLERNQGAIDEAHHAAAEAIERKIRLAAVNREREEQGLPPLASGGFLKPGRPYIVGETPSEQTRPKADDQDDA